MEVELRPVVVPGGDPGRVRVFVVGEGLTALAVQTEARDAGPIVRGQGPPYVVIVENGRRLRATEPARQRRDFLPAVAAPGRDSHAARFGRRFPARRMLSLAGCGNLLCNPGVIATTADGVFGAPGPSGPPFRLDDGATVTGPALVVAGRARAPDPAHFADLRHLLLPAWTELAPGLRVDFGLDFLLTAPDALADAVRGRPVALPLREFAPLDDAVDAPPREFAVAPAALRTALAAKGYRESAAVAEPGEYRLAADALTIRFLPGVYPHHALARDRAGRAWSVLVAGRSNREGTTIVALAQALAAAGAVEAVLLDNGGDVGLLERGAATDPAAASPDPEWRFALRPAEADRATAWPLRACVVRYEE